GSGGDARLSVTVEPAGVTATRLSAGALQGVDGWLVTRPWAETVGAARERAGLEPALGVGPVVARSPVVLAVWPDRAEALRGHCPAGRIEWACLGDRAGQRWEELGGQPAWGLVKPGHADPGHEATGLVVLGAAATGFFGNADFSRVEIEEDDRFRGWLRRLERAVPTFRPSAGTPLQDMLLKGPAAFDVVGTTEAEGRALLAAAARSDKPVLLYPAPVATADLVLASSGSGPASQQLARLLRGEAGRQALARDGWRVGRGAPPAGSPPLAPGPGLPDAGVLQALLQAWREATG
ncbi:MAG TPA: substrate-binding domain-containing protein, partial [Acidimicrobiales bacterium]|nr:substrate-binding domain-containing protein [Acidimicrobiales bacterium]